MVKKKEWNTIGHVSTTMIILRGPVCPAELFLDSGKGMGPGWYDLGEVSRRGGVIQKKHPYKHMLLSKGETREESSLVMMAPTA